MTLLRFVNDDTGRELDVEPRHVILGGFAGRDQEAVQAHVKELAAHGIPAPDRTPTFYRITADRVVQTDEIEVLGGRTSGEGEFIAFDHAGALYVGVGSDHTDREVERDSIRAAKQLCPKVIGSRVWEWSRAAEHWDHVELLAFTGDGDSPAIPYQRAPVTALMDPEEVLRRAMERSGLARRDGLMVWSGTVATLTDLAFGRSFTVELADLQHDRTLRVEYRVRIVEPLD